MRRNEDEILAEEMAALATPVGVRGGLIRLVAKLMKKNVHEIDLVLPLAFEDAVEHVVEVLGREGRTVDPQPVQPGGDQHTVRVVAGGGAGGMNPVLVTASVTKGRETGSSSEVRLRAAAKEGLIKQRVGERTAARLAALLAE
ncbi:hypothetical protein [Streptomyces tailanensis]|uniref:hypothetical protein n=1 Tax=Streptomyces tailanensis TaxID=2569858 RepID=UPI00122E892A|nr:hypothetical protein [Streptomyces tailanensis]